MNKMRIILITGLMLFISTPLWAGVYQYLPAAELKQKMALEQPLQLLDIQVEKEFSQHHIKGALPTYAYPVKSASDRAKLDKTIAQLKSSTDPIVVVCPRGGGGAKRAYDYLQQQGISEERLFILEKGQADWPYPGLLATR